MSSTLSSVASAPQHLHAHAPNLPYIGNGQRISLLAPCPAIGCPTQQHSRIGDDWYGGVFIPKGTIRLANLWQCSHNPALYGDDAANFNPGRFLDEHGRPSGEA